MSTAEIHGGSVRLRKPWIPHECAHSHGAGLRRAAAALLAIGIALTGGGHGAQSSGESGGGAKPLPAGPSAEARMAPAMRDENRPPVHRATARVTRTTPVPILMYHVIAHPPEDAPYPDLYVTPRRFAEHVAYLARHRYHAVTLQQVWDHWHGGRPLPPRPVVVSFDDGSRGWYTHAFPILRRHGWVGTMNLALSHLNRVDLRVRWVRRLIAAGWELASHTFTHRDLTALSGRDLRREVVGSRTRLRRLFGVPVNFFCYPSGRYDATVLAAVRKAGYLGATTTVEGFAAPGRPLELKRIRVNGSDRAVVLGQKLDS